MFLLKPNPSFEQIAREVLRLKKLKSKNTQACARHQISRLIRFFGTFKIREITESDWTDYVLHEQEKKARRFYDDRKYMRMILLHALRAGFLEKKVTLSIPDVPRQVGREISREEITRLRAAAGPELLLQIDISWKMGFRLREMLRLNLAHFDWERGTVKLSASETKTRKGREVPIPPDLVPRIKAHFEALGTFHLFPSPAGRTRPQESNKSAWRRCKRDAGVRARWHDLRHTCATIMLRRGVKRNVARAILGMSDKVLAEIYAHLDLGDLHAAASAMDGEA